jgi:hypothetical protein
LDVVPTKDHPTSLLSLTLCLALGGGCLAACAADTAPEEDTGCPYFDEEEASVDEEASQPLIKSCNQCHAK